MKTRHEQLREKCIAFHEKHPEVWDMFCEKTFSRISLGFKNHSSRAVLEAVRWENEKPEYEKGEEFKINDHITPFYARAFMKKYPQYDGFFRTREQISKNKSATGLPELGPRDFPYE